MTNITFGPRESWTDPLETDDVAKKIRNNTPEVHEEFMVPKTENLIECAEVILSQMQSRLASVKKMKKMQSELTATIQELSIKLAEAQAEEIRITESLLDQKTEWQELTQKLSAIEDLDADSN
ncbi:MAG: hypothetical protein GX154_12865 [Clostridiales bacterium]|nr:hypothetical protein [Clostridiales bacterium]